mmetsp:Transcript_35257/g.75093  ORF Transcript_35257/g.75093 Transcript_35257/m.75093 type:complete len:889 (-) Transcript_35257:46-2712(-)
MTHAPQREKPWCISFLVIGALSAHIMVFVGNLRTAGVLHALGASTKGWSQVGLSLSAAMDNELSPALANISSLLSETIDAVTELEKSTDVLLSATGSATDAGISSYDPSSKSPRQQKDEIMKELRNLTDELMSEMSPLVDRFIYAMTPAAKQMQGWTVSFGAKVRPSVENFMATLDTAQKMFDQIMSSFRTSGGAGQNEDEMIYNTYTLFDTDNSGSLYPEDLQSAAQLFGISALAGNKAQELFATYNTDKKGGISASEYKKFVHDPSIPGVMTLVLRTYSKALSEIAGRLASATTRTDTAVAVVDYIQVISSKNQTRLGWITETLSNGTLPIQFTAAVLKELAISVDDPNLLAVVDAGPIVVKAIAGVRPDFLVKALTLLAEPSFWESEGYQMEDQPLVMARLVNWTSAVPSGVAALRQGGKGLFKEFDNDDLVTSAYEASKELQLSAGARELADAVNQELDLYATSAAQFFRQELLGGVPASSAAEDAAATASRKRGSPAAPATRLWVQWVASNASLTAKQHLQECFDYSGESSGKLESIAKRITAVFTKVESFLELTDAFLSPEGTERLLNRSLAFVREGGEDLLEVCEDFVDAQLADINCRFQGGLDCNMTQQEKSMALDLSGAFDFLTTSLKDLKGVMPTVLTNLDYAKREVNAVSSVMNSMMMVLGLKAPPFMYQLSEIYRGFWIAYFVVFGLLTLGVLGYGFWACGYFGGPSVHGHGEEPATGIRARLSTCFMSCTNCMRSCHDSHITFWSVMLLAEIVVLLLFLICVVICLLGGVQAFLSAGCSQVYILGDNRACTSSLQVVKTFLSSFWSDAADSMDGICMEESLLTCSLITNSVIDSVEVSVIGGVLASSLSFWMVIESAVMHERARLTRLDLEDKEG